MARHAVVNAQGQVINVIEWDGSSPWAPPEGHITVESEIADSLDKYDHKSECFTKICNGRTYHKSARYKDYINDRGHIQTGVENVNSTEEQPSINIDTGPAELSGISGQLA